MRLSELRNGERAYIHRLDAPAALRSRLQELGLIVGEQAERLYAAPAGSPIVFRVMGQRVSLRRDEAECVVAGVSADTAGIEESCYQDSADSAQPFPPSCSGTCAACGLRHCPSCAKPDAGHAEEGEMTIALVGNPNCGKTAFFNAASGGHERTGNYAGVTVTSIVGRTRIDGIPVRVVDLPGAYSLNAVSPDEAFVRHELAGGAVDAIVNVTDVNALERHLLLTLQLQQMKKPMVCALNMYDDFSQNGSSLDVGRLEERLQMPCIPTVARRGDGVEHALRRAVEAVCAARLNPPSHEDAAAAPAASLSARRAAVREMLQDIYSVRTGRTERWTDLLDRLTAHGPLAYIVWLLVMLLVFTLTFQLGAYPMEWIDAGVGLLGEWLGRCLPEGLVHDLLIDGILGGVGSVIVFLPNILILYLCISLLEDSGYLARAAMLADPLFARIGLHGKSFVPMLMGFGCNVPAVMATRTIANRKTRLLTMLAVPFMSCSARLPVYVVFCGAFFPHHAVLVMTLLYFLGIIMAVFFSWMFNRVYHRKADATFVMEIPAYRAPLVGSVLRHTWEKGRQYLRKMGGVILVASIVVWTLGYFPRPATELSPAEQQEQSYLGVIGHAIEPLFSPLGFDWRMDVGILAGTGAKELMVSTLGVLYDCPEEDAQAEDAAQASSTRLAKALQASHTPQAALAYMVFALFYFPCFATVIAIASESGKRRMALFTAVYTTAVAYLMAWVAFTLVTLIL